LLVGTDPADGELEMEIGGLQAEVERIAMGLEELAGEVVF
jgi:hypothetical protein